MMFGILHFSLENHFTHDFICLCWLYVFSSCQQVGSQCTILTDNYCEDAYELLDTPILKKLLVLMLCFVGENEMSNIKENNGDRREDMKKNY